MATMKSELVRPFVVVEGMSSSGKSTAVRGMDKYLVDWVKVREPGGTEFGDLIRTVVQQTEFGHPVDPLAAFLGYSASRAQLVSEVIMPQLVDGENVISDRWWYSSYAYQGGGEGLDRGFIRAVSLKVTRGLVPLTLFFDLVPEVVLERRGAKDDLDRYDLQAIDFFARVRQAYLELGEQVDHWRVIDASQSRDKVVQDCLEVLCEYGLVRI
ncbi:MAG: Thymidylate kinase [Microgenomates group bacterium ADurb.Bin238]|nr:MAG: Thymidylate kinase [Microgenomates group bacterium ADurb.Bin238]